VVLRLRSNAGSELHAPANVAGLPAVRPAGFITEKSPKAGAPHCSAQLVAHTWRVGTAKRAVPMPFAIAPVAGKSFREMLPSVAPDSAQPQTSLTDWIRWSPAMRLSKHSPAWVPSDRMAIRVVRFRVSTQRILTPDALTPLPLREPTFGMEPSRRFAPWAAARQLPAPSRRPRVRTSAVMS
jgi:hypothetical protein